MMYILWRSFEINVVDKTLIDKAQTYTFVQLWFQWNELHLTALSKSEAIPYGYRCGVFYGHGAHYWQHHDDWPPFFDEMALLGVPYTSIHALFCYLKYPACKNFIDTGGVTPA
jgi:hypothetical protein